MQYSEKLAWLERWRKQYRESKAVWDAAKPVLGDAAPESGLWQAHWGCFGELTTAVAALVGDHHGNLEWYWLENDFGAGRGKVTKGEETREIKGLGDLLWAIELA